MSLPLLESMMPRRLNGAAVEALEAPARLVFIHTESGMWMENFTPRTTGSGYVLPPTLEPLAAFRDDFTVCSGLFHEAAFRRNACGRHCQDTACFLTGADLGAVPGVPTRNTVSVDQVAVRHLGQRTRFPHLHFSVGGIGSMVYSENGTPIPPETNPAIAFQRLFSDQSPEARKGARRRLALNRSVLDDVLGSARELCRRIGREDRAKLDDYLTNVREIERRIQVADRWLEEAAPAPPAGTREPPVGGSRTERIRALMDVAALALQTDQTRVVTLQIGGMGCQYPEIGAPDSYHAYTHSDGKADKIARMQRVDRHRVAHVAYFLGRLKGVREGERDLLYPSAILYGSGMGQTHEGKDLPNLILGHGRGRLKPGRHLDFKGKPLAGLFLSMLHAAGVEEKRFADASEGLGV